MDLEKDYILTPWLEEVGQGHQGVLMQPNMVIEIGTVIIKFCHIHQKYGYLQSWSHYFLKVTRYILLKV